MSDYTFMKTGLMAPSDGGAAALEDFVTRVLGVIAVMLQKAVETAGVFAEHGMYHREITADDIRRAMKVQAQTFFKSEGDDLENRVASMVRDIQQQQKGSLRSDYKQIKLRPILRRGKGKKTASGSDCVSDLSDLSDLSVPSVPSVPDFDLPYNTCECPTCTEIRTLVDGWETWNPEDEVEQFLKRHIDQM